MTGDDPPEPARTEPLPGYGAELGSAERSPIVDPGRCPRCHFELDEGTPPELCPRCLLGRAIGASRAPEGAGESPERFGAYELGAKLGQGGMGLVYAARQAHTGRLVALKRIREGELADDRARRRFFDEAATAARLDHPHIVPLYDAGEHDGQPYYTMKLMTGGTLAAAAARFREPRRAAELLATLARAVHEGHRQGILHRDLKPENVLFDERGDPHIGDFGVAKHVSPGASESGAVVGTPYYMAPEQAQARRATVAVDVWSLGVILYELLAGRPPFTAPTPVELLRRVLEEEPAPLRRRRRDVGHDLETVCLTCLRKDPRARYASAEALADDLERFARGEPVAAREPGPIGRALLWCARHRLAAGLLLAAMATLVGLTLGAGAIAAAQRRALRDEVLATNAYAAWAVAGTVLAQIEEYTHSIEDEAVDPRLAAALARGDRAGLDAHCRAIHVRRGGPASPFATWLILDREGAPRGHYPEEETEYYELRLDFRDYFQGAMAIAPGARRNAYVSRVLRSSSDANYKFALSAPIRDPAGALLGALVTTIVTDRRLGALELSDERRVAMLVGRRDRPAAGAPLPEAYMVLVRDGVDHGEGVVVDSAALRRLSSRAARASSREQLHLSLLDQVERESDHRDPLGSRDGYDGPWLAGVAPVGGTELAAIVETRLDDAVAVDRGTYRVIALWSVGGALLLAAGFVAAVRGTRRRGRAPR
jgi:serine/threonine-protein kinase